MKEEVKNEGMSEKIAEEQKQRDLYKRIQNLETSVQILKAIVDIYATKNGIRIQNIGNGIIVVSQME